MILRIRFLICFAFVTCEQIQIENMVKDYIEVPKLNPEYTCSYNCFPHLNAIEVEEIIKDSNGETIFRFDEYPKLEDIFRYMSFLSSRYKDRVQIFDIGYTADQLPLRVARIVPPNNFDSTVWIDGGIHAREWISITSVCFIIHILVEHWDKLDPSLQNTQFFLLPVMNPDGFRYSYTKSRMWRKNRRFMGDCYGVDLNRNFPYKWGTINYLIKDGIWQQKKPCNEIYEGPGPLSEPESRAVVRFISMSGLKFDAFLTFHSYGQKITYPYGFEPRIPKDAALLEYVAQRARYKIRNATKVDYNVSPLSMTDYVSPGNSVDWAYKMNITFSYLIELSHDSFTAPVSEILPTGREAFTILQTVVENLDMSTDEMATIQPPNEIFSEVVHEM